MTADGSGPAREGPFRRLLRRLGLRRRAAPPAPRALPAPPHFPAASGAPDPRWPDAGGHSRPGAYAASFAGNGAHPARSWQQPAWGPPAPPPDPSPDPGLLTEALAGLAVRDLTMVESLLDIVGSLEDSTEDPDLLAKLFEIDNLATRMRRNGENLLVLADQESDDSGVEPVALLDVARAATSEIKNYSRVQIGRLPDRFIAGEVADDLSHLLAELLDNATNHSPDHAQVVISGQLMSEGGLLVVVEDEGIGIPQDQLADINTRLAGTPVLDKRVMRHMGLYVASRIAHRHGLRVQLEARAFRGVNAYTVVPASLLSATGPVPQSGVPAAVPAQAAPAMAEAAAAAGRQSAGAHHAGAHRAPTGGAADQDGAADSSSYTAAGLPRRSAAHGSPLRMMAAQQPAAAPAPAETPGDRAERIRDELDGFMEGERAATREGGGEEAP
ncbi:sensor histidine kinase [Streptomonospora sp. PA3]|uniref:sensor histidine kinase n=1 Tax=Streptomonospora sp. PA3 TaxID=2607326 RepID=UPI0012DDFC5D|nr:ATP-binding protein [Streptomonospora sp. PA3]MUL43630.1 sensor histidine kinase [Streptomonospora sp. PA3]